MGAKGRGGVEEKHKAALVIRGEDRGARAYQQDVSRKRFRFETINGFGN